MRFRLPVLVIGLCLFVPQFAGATVVVPLDLKQLAGNSTAILRGRVVSLTPQWATEGRGIETVVTVEVTTYLKGDFGAQMTFKVPGGKIGRLRSVTVGAPVFREGEEVILFLRGSGADMPRVVGFNQGVYRVSVDNTSGARVVTSPLLAETAAPGRIVRGDPARKPMAVDQFEARVRAAVQERRDDQSREPRGGIRDKRVR